MFKKKNFKWSVIIGLSIFILGCSDILDKEPLSEVTPDNFFNTEGDLRLYTNSFYFMFPAASIYNGEGTTDNIIELNVAPRLRDDRIVPTDAGTAEWTWENLRKVNYFLENYSNATGTNAKLRYSGVARFFRAYFYFNKVKRFGDVPWYSNPIEPGDEEALEKSRHPRSLVMDSVMADLDYAIENMPESQNVYEVTKWTALALQSRAALFEGTFRKYHNLSDAEKFLNIAWEAADELMRSGIYQIYSTGDISSDYQDLFSSHDAIATEIILAKQFGGGEQIDHNANYYTTTSSFGQPSMPKDLVNSYLMSDGSRYTDRPDYQTTLFVDEVKDRDPRLSQTIRTPGYSRLGETREIPPNLSAAKTGYQLTKFVIETEYDPFDSNINDLPIFRYAETLLNYAEARAELGILTQDDLDQSINVIRARVGMPGLMLSEANANPDPFLQEQYKNVDKGSNEGVILEIRRERRIELFMENFRWDDLMRWKEGQKAVQPFRGMYFPGEGEYDLDGDESIDVVLYSDPIENQQDGVQYYQLGDEIVLGPGGLIDPHPEIQNRTFDENKSYFYPLPLTELQLNPNLEQNPGWN